MARIPTYEIDPVIHDLDMLLGTDYNNQDHTKNFKLSGIADYVIDKLIEPNAVQSCIPVFRNVSDVQGGNAQRITSSIINQNIYPNGTNISIAGTLDVEKSIEIKGNANGSGSLQLKCEQNSHGVTIQAPSHAQQGNYTLILPVDVGSGGQVLTTEGTGGQLYWSDKDDDNLNIAGDTNTGVVDLDNQTLTISGGTLINTSVLPDGGQNITIQHDSVNRTDIDQSTTLAFGDSFNAISILTSDQGGHVENVTTQEYTLPDAPTPVISSAFIDIGKIPVWYGSSADKSLGAMLDPQGVTPGNGGIYGGFVPELLTTGSNPNYPNAPFIRAAAINLYNGALANVSNLTFSQQGRLTVDSQGYQGGQIVVNPTVVGGISSSDHLIVGGQSKFVGRINATGGGICISNNPSGVVLDNTSMVIGAGNNDIISGCDNSLAVGNGNQITANSDNTTAIGTGNTLSGAKNSLVVGLGNTISLSTPGHSIVQGQNNTLNNSYSSFVAGGNNTVNVDQNAFVLGYSHDLTGADSFVVLGENNTSTNSASDNNVYMIGGNLKGKDGTMVLGFRNDETSYPTTDYTNGLGNTKFVVGVGTDINSPANNNAVIITEGGVTRGGAGVLQVPRVVLPTVVNFNFADDTAAAAAGIPVGGVYHSSGVLKIRIS